jgi:hypothetical protein
MDGIMTLLPYYAETNETVNVNEVILNCLMDVPDLKVASMILTTRLISLKLFASLQPGS